MDQHKDKRLKYVDLNNNFHSRATELRLLCRTHARACERIAERLAKQKPKTPEEFERVEWMKDFVLKTAQVDDKVLELIGYIHGLLTDIGEDSKVLIEGAILRDRMQMQSDNIEQYMQMNDNQARQIYELKKSELRGTDQGNS